MNDRAQTRPRPLWSSSEGAPTQKEVSQQSTVEGYEEAASQSSSAGAVHYPTPPSSSSKMEYTPSNVQRTVSGSAVTQLTPNDDITGTKPTGNRTKRPREARNSKNKGAHRPASTSSGPEPHFVPHEAFASSPESNYFKNPPSGRQAAPLTYNPSNVSAANYPQSPISPNSYTSWGPNHTPVGYPPSQGPFSAQQSGFPPIEQHYHLGFTSANQKVSELEPAFVNQDRPYDTSYLETEDDMDAHDNGLPIEALNGYASIAARISGQAEPHLKPIYRRFDWLYHRNLLYFQDELGALEEELRHVDSITTRMDGGMPVSAREERISIHQIHRDRHRLMERIHNVLHKYSKCAPAFNMSSSNLIRGGNVNTRRNSKAPCAGER
ncbi:hypothetical protein FBEOM_780 [Fusarium beomiforme]|uniref:DUF6594 domain-containing protein n=1 Tax=Fusarium beomiforme TaxID=44412 RepID=A0A9P5AV46_9HYPO|nr:hypothetical protein FBEOM_780 [Fusarium beomiforme]